MRGLLKWLYPSHCQVLHAQELEDCDEDSLPRPWLLRCVFLPFRGSSKERECVSSLGFVLSCNAFFPVRDTSLISLWCERILWILPLACPDLLASRIFVPLHKAILSDFVRVSIGSFDLSSFMGNVAPEHNVFICSSFGLLSGSVDLIVILFVFH